MDKESDIIRFVHHTTQEYFEQTQSKWFPDAEANITIICVTYLSFSVFESGFCQTDDEFEEQLRSNPFYDYAACNWGYHARKAQTSSQIVIDFLESNAHVKASSQAMMVDKRYSFRYSQDVPRHMTGAHLAAYFGLEEIKNSLLIRRHKSDTEDTSGRTPLSWALINGYEVVVQLLLPKDRIDFNSKESEYRPTMLSWNAVIWHGAIIELLAKDGIDVNLKDPQY